MTFFGVASIFFTVFTLIYLLASSAIFYHLRQYTLPGQFVPKVVLTAFTFLSILFWLFALTLLFKIPG